ncbi:unnamed protein product [marine sediment metagenome]|uniref:Uncharacterized protein n=1 Tax=marine sediment metagenome TaxID=412755 RepID=X1G1Q0_9ZZZZ
MSEEYTKICMKNYCDKAGTVEVQSLYGNWIPFCKEHVPKHAKYIRKIWN